MDRWNAHRHIDCETDRRFVFIRAGRWRAQVLALVLVLLLAVYANAEAFRPVHATVTKVDQFGNIMLDLEQTDLEYGDSVNVSFSGGYEFKSVPYYPDFYGKMGSVLLTDIFDTLCVSGISCNVNLMAGIEPGETATITLEQKGRYKEEFEAYNINNARYRMEGQTDEAFRNAREVTFGDIRPGRLYRGSSPFDPSAGRIELMGSYLLEHNIGGVFDLADSRETLEAYEGLPDHTAAMIAQGQVITSALGVDYLQPKAMQSIGEGLNALTELEGPWLIQCTLGRDRTGVICALVEALCGADYDEIVQDYMQSYDNLHEIDMDPDSLQYQLFKARIDEYLTLIFGVETQDLPDIDMRAASRDYLIRCGMTEDQIDKLERLLTAP